MKTTTLAFVAGLALLSAGCVAVPITPTGGGGGSTGSLASAVGGGQAYVNTQNGQRLNLWSDGGYTLTTGGQQSYGTWRAVDNPVSMCFTGQVAAHAGGACVLVRYDGDFLEIYDVLGSFVIESWAVEG